VKPPKKNHNIKTNLIKEVLVMFRSFIYVNSEKVYEYYSLLDETIKEKITSKESSRTNKAGISSKPIGFEHSRTETMKSEISQYFLSDYNKFEKELIKLAGEYYFDLDEEEYDLKTMPRSSIGKVQANFIIPEGFDYIDLIDAFKPMIKSAIEINDSEQALYDTFLGNTKADIPITIEYEGLNIFGKLDTRFLKETYNQLEEYEFDEVTILFKFIAQDTSTRVTIFDPLKDFIKLNRAMRRSSDFQNSYSEELSPIVVDGPVIKTEILAIYK
jgi:hypothetical protein